MNKARRQLLFCYLLAFILACALLIFVRSGANSVVKFSQEKRKVVIYLEHDHILGDSNESVQIDGTTVTIYKGGSYQLEGVLDDGQIIVKAGRDEDVVLKLNSVDITCRDSAPLMILSGGTVKLKLKDNTVNYFRDGSQYKESLAGDVSPNACIYSREDLIVKGQFGTLNVEGNYKHGIYSADDIRIQGGSLHVQASKTGIRGKDSVKIEDGTIDVQAGQDGIYGNDKVQISGGQVDIDAKRYGIFGRNLLRISGDSEVSIENALSAIAGIGEIKVPDDLSTGKEDSEGRTAWQP